MIKKITIIAFIGVLFLTSFAGHRSLTNNVNHHTTEVVLNKKTLKR